MQALAIINRSKLECDLYRGGKHSNFSHQIKKQSDVDEWIAKLLSEGWHLFNVAGDYMYFVSEMSQSPAVGLTRAK
jgi:hypothetical protein